MGRKMFYGEHDHPLDDTFLCEGCGSDVRKGETCEECEQREMQLASEREDAEWQLLEDADERDQVLPG